VVIDDFDIAGSFLSPNKTDSELIVNADAVLTFSVSPERLEPVASNGSEILNGFSGIQTNQAHPGLIFNVDEFSHAFVAEQSFRPRIFERL
jgi:hypothetical protein